MRAGIGLWIALSMMAAIIACALAATRHYAWCIVALAMLALSLIRIFNNVERLRRHVRYLLYAAVNGDFSYKFRDNSLTHQGKEINDILNQLVIHLEKLSENTRQNEDLLRKIIDLVDSGIVMSNDKGHILHANKSALNMLGRPMLTDMSQIPDHTEGLSITKTLSMHHGERLTIYTITDMRRQLQSAEVQSWINMTRVLTHEIMNSLTPINSIAESMGREPSLDRDEMLQQLDVISSSSRSLMQFVSNFRRFTVLPSPNPGVIYVKACIHKVVALMRTQPGAADIEFDVEVFPPDAMVYTDESMLNQVLINIVKNAIEANPTKIAIKTKIRDDEAVEISIANNGEPIEPEIASQIFTPFFTTKPSGSGIGLSLSRRIISQLGGSLSLTLQPYPTFTITL